MARMAPALEAEGLRSTRMLLQVHDELVFEVPEADAARASEVIRRVMEGAAEPTVNLSVPLGVEIGRSEEHTSELQSLMRISYAGFCLKKKNLYIVRIVVTLYTTVVDA